MFIVAIKKPASVLLQAKKKWSLASISSKSMETRMLGKKVSEAQIFMEAIKEAGSIIQAKELYEAGHRFNAVTGKWVKVK